MRAALDEEPDIAKLVRAAWIACVQVARAGLPLLSHGPAWPLVFFWSGRVGCGRGGEHWATRGL
jgi:hypothetical protein